MGSVDFAESVSGRWKTARPLAREYSHGGNRLPSRVIRSGSCAGLGKVT